MIGMLSQHYCHCFNLKYEMVFFIFVSCFNTAIAEQEKFYTVKMGEIPSQVLPQNAMYAKPVFSRGTAFFRDGTTYGQQFKYNFLLDEMHFVGGAGDTLAIGDPVLLKSVVIDSMVFYYENGYLQEALKSGKYILAVKRKMVQVVNQKRGGYDATSETGAIVGALGKHAAAQIQICFKL